MTLEVNPQMLRQVRSRCVFYLSGFDPKGAGHYHALYRNQASTQERITGVPLTVGARQKTSSGDSFWTVTSADSHGEVQTHYAFLHWDDIVREHWQRSFFKLVAGLVGTTLLNLRTGTLWRMFKLSWPPAMALLAPFLLLSGVLIGVPFVTSVAVVIAPASAGWVAKSLLALSTLALWLGIALALEKKYWMEWLLRSYTFTAAQADGAVPELDARLEQHAQHVLSRIESGGDDEVLIIGHSSGCMMAASILSKALSLDPKLGIRGPVVSLLTLGHCMPMLGCLPNACVFRSDLQTLARSEAVDWIDISAPPDSCCFALTDPLKACGVVSSQRSTSWPKLLSPRFAEMFEPANYASIRRDKFRMHFQYLMSGEKAAKYDFFAITAGASILADRFANESSVDNYREFQIFR